jgi:hypothetical protein
VAIGCHFLSHLKLTTIYESTTIMTPSNKSARKGIPLESVTTYRNPFGGRFAKILAKKSKI